jgi:hypothetical protein
MASGEYVFAWAGLPYWPGNPPGEPSVRRFLARVAEVGVVEASPELGGSYFLVIEHLPSRKCYAFIDGSGMHNAFRAGGIVSTSFLGLARSLGLTCADLDPEAVVEFLNTGMVFFGRTLLPQIRRIAWDEVVAFSADGKAEVLRKPIDDIAAPPRRDFVEHFAQLARDFRNERCSINLTGGVDSRLVAALLAHFGLEFEVAISGTEGHPDVVKSRQIAALLGREHYLTRHTVENVEAELPELFGISNGTQDVLRLHRLHQHVEQQVARGVSVVFTGVEAALYSDKLWMQDFTFYHRKKANVARFFDYRILPFPLAENVWGPAYRPASRELRSRVLAGLQDYVDSTNTRTYDRVAYYVRGQAGASQSSALSSLVGFCTPLLEPDVARTGFNLPRHMRFADRFQRMLITRYCPELVPVRTTEDGVTLSSKPLDQLNDLRCVVGNRLKRLVKKVVQRASGKTLFQTRIADHRDFLPKVMRSPTAAELIGELRDARILAEDADVGRVGAGRLGRALTLAFLVRHLNETAPESPAGDRAAGPLVVS